MTSGNAARARSKRVQWLECLCRIIMDFGFWLGGGSVVFRCSRCFSFFQSDFSFFHFSLSSKGERRLREGNRK